MLEDLGSKNGTFLGDTPVTKRVPVADGDRLRLGSVLLTFRLGPTEEDSTQTVTPSSPPQRRG
jgi:pSer/pThr/pTyr-binding forkhead associated (FHA) protein